MLHLHRRLYWRQLVVATAGFALFGLGLRSSGVAMLVHARTWVEFTGGASVYVVWIWFGYRAMVRVMELVEHPITSRAGRGLASAGIVLGFLALTFASRSDPLAMVLAIPPMVASVLLAAVLVDQLPRRSGLGSR